jgi:hypothetical protein
LLAIFEKKIEKKKILFFFLLHFGGVVDKGKDFGAYVVLLYKKK